MAMAPTQYVEEENLVRLEATFDPFMALELGLNPDDGGMLQPGDELEDGQFVRPL